VLRAVRDSEFRPAACDRTFRLECRIVLGCTEDLSPLVDRGQFRSDLFYALSAVTIKLPPLRHRGQDIMRLAEHFRERFARIHGKSVVGISPEACRRLTGHDWPDNVSELKNVIDHAVARCRGHWIEPNHLCLDTPAVPSSRDGLNASTSRDSILPLKEALEEPEKRLILEALRALGWNRQETARVLDINRTTLYKKMKKYGLIYEEPVWTN
jgi:two-component system response regulator HydG